MKQSQNCQYNYQRLIFKFKDKKYTFSFSQILIFLVASPLLSILIYLFLKLKINYWIYNLTSAQIVLILNTFFNLNSEVIISSTLNGFPSIFVPNNPFNENYAITANCIAAPVFSIVISIIIFVPSSKIILEKKEFVWRKIKALIVSIIGIYILNIFRIVFLIFFNFNGIPFEFIHESLFFLSAVVGALYFVIILKLWLPESFISIYYFYRLILKKWKIRGSF